mmetsp:Transcript_16112/g.39689  ORF Transcript_16112/g.39689 Transcript_16112/m.39689 type:complete len:210 (+) Transcript_16112:1517-2146(+)
MLVQISSKAAAMPEYGSSWLCMLYFPFPTIAFSYFFDTYSSAPSNANAVLPIPLYPLMKTNSFFFFSTTSPKAVARFEEWLLVSSMPIPSWSEHTDRSIHDCSVRTASSRPMTCSDLKFNLLIVNSCTNLLSFRVFRLSDDKSTTNCVLSSNDLRSDDDIDLVDFLELTPPDPVNDVTANADAAAAVRDTPAASAYSRPSPSGSLLVPS